MFLAALAASLSAWAKVKCVSNVPAGRSAVGVQLPGVGDPFVDQDQAGAVLVEQFLERVAGVRGVLVVLLDELVAFLAAKLPGDLAPEGADDGPVGLLVGLAWGNLRADEDGPVDVRWESGSPSSLTSSSTPGSSPAGRAGEEVIQGQHRVRLAAAEVGLQLDDRIASLAGQPEMACVSSRRKPSVKNVRRKNSVGCLYSSEPSPW